LIESRCILEIIHVCLINDVLSARLWLIVLLGLICRNEVLQSDQAIILGNYLC